MRHSRTIAIALASTAGLLSGCAAVLIPSGASATASVLDPPGAIELSFTYHAQQDPDWCDPADIEMWLGADGVALPAGTDDAIQDVFWSYETSHNDGYTIAQWNASPYAVAVTLDHFGNRSDVGDAPQPSLEAAGTVISHSIADLHQPVIVMVGGATHYVLITGVKLGGKGANGPPVAVTLANPLQFGVGASPPSGSNGAISMSWADFTGWYTANTHHGGVWAGKWVLIAAGIPLAG
ncbi:MAG: hypothetical protein ACLQGJ_01650 [Candidatus Dormibacteria bacterium]